MRYYIRIGMLSLQHETLWALHHVSPILCQINKHLQDALLTKLLGQFIEVHKSQKTFSRTRKCDLRLYCSLFLQHFAKLGVNLTH